jgi:hypothetical protein
VTADAGDRRGGDRPLDATAGVVGADRAGGRVGQALVASGVEDERLARRRSLAAAPVERGIRDLAPRAVRVG